MDKPRAAQDNPKSLGISITINWDGGSYRVPLRPQPVRNRPYEFGNCNIICSLNVRNTGLADLSVVNGPDSLSP